MNQLFFLVCFSLFNVFLVCGQNENDSDLISKTENLLKIKSHFRDSISNIYRAGYLHKTDSLIRHASLKKDIENDTIINKVEFYSNLNFIRLERCPIDYVNDWEYDFSENEITQIDSIIKNLEKETTNEIVIVTLDTFGIVGKNFDSLITATHNNWGAGKAVKNN